MAGSVIRKEQLDADTLNAQREAFILELTNLHARAFQLGLAYTGHQLHEAVQRVGFEYASLRDRQLKTHPRLRRPYAS